MDRKLRAQLDQLLRTYHEDVEYDKECGEMMTSGMSSAMAVIKFVEEHLL